MERTSIIPVGTVAPDFSLPIGTGSLDRSPENTFVLSKTRDKNVILTFYPADWSSVCSSQIALYNELLPVFAQYDAEIYGISVDGTFCHAAFKKHNNIALALLCDFEPKGAIAKLYGAYDHQIGVCKRALYVLDKNGVIRYSYLSPMDVNPGAKEILETLKTLTS